MTTAFYAVAATCDFYPEDAPGLIEPSFLVLPDRAQPFGSGLYRIEFIRTLSPDEHKDYVAALRAAASTPTGSKGEGE